jgi:hypothetical protein
MSGNTKSALDGAANNKWPCWCRTALWWPGSFTLYATRTILSGQGTELIELAKTNPRERETE